MCSLAGHILNAPQYNVIICFWRHVRVAEWSKLHSGNLASGTRTYVRFPVMATFFRNLYKLFLLMVYRSIIQRIVISLYNIVLLQHFVYRMTKDLKSNFARFHNILAFIILTHLVHNYNFLKCKQC